jgi:hypothetical protein
MEIAPIAGIRAFGLAGSRTLESGAPRFEINGSARTGDDAYKASRQGPDRGLEEEEQENEAAEEAETAASSESADGGPQIDVVA